MARKTLIYTESAEGRDKGKKFLITELPAEAAEEWGTQALFTLMNCGVHVPDDLAKQGLAGVAAIGLEALQKVKYADAKPLFEKMMDCVQVMPDPQRPEIVRALFSDDIEEIITRIKLRAEIIKLHIGFFIDAAKLTSG